MKKYIEPLACPGGLGSFFKLRAGVHEGSRSPPSLRVVDPPLSARTAATTRFHILHFLSPFFPSSPFPLLPFAAFCAQDGLKVSQDWQSLPSWVPSWLRFTIFQLLVGESCTLRHTFALPASGLPIQTSSNNSPRTSSDK